MPFPTVCPNCDARLTAPDTVLGKKVKCKKCDEPFVAKRASAEDEDERPAKPAKTGSRSRRDDDSPPSRKAAKATRPADDEEDEDEPRPKAKKKGKKKKKQGSPVLLFVLLGIGALVLLGGGGAGVYFAFIHEPDKKTEPSGTAGDVPKGPGGKGGPAIPMNITWIDYTAPNGTFTAKLPQQPIHTSPTVQSPAGPIQAELYQADSPQFVAVVVSADIPGVQPGQALPQAQVDQALEAACNGMVQRLQGAREVSRTTISHQGNPGREVVIAAPDGSGGTARVFIANGRMWNLMFVNKRGKPDQATLSTFFDGFVVQ
jgi:hypothetical protein